MQYTTNLRKVNSAENITLLLRTEILILLNNYKNNVRSKVFCTHFIFTKFSLNNSFRAKFFAMVKTMLCEC